MYQRSKLIGNTPDFQLYVVRSGLSTSSKGLLQQQSSGAPCSGDTLQGFSLAPCKLLTGAHARISMDFFGPALTLNFNIQDSLHKRLSHEQTEITGAFAATQVTRAYSCEVLCKYYWHAHFTMQMETFYGAHLNIDSSNCLPSPRKAVQVSTVQPLMGTGLFLSIH